MVALLLLSPTADKNEKKKKQHELFHFVIIINLTEEFMVFVRSNARDKLKK